jgi:hypothetical protein
MAPRSRPSSNPQRAASVRLRLAHALPRKRTSPRTQTMSALGQDPTSSRVGAVTDAGLTASSDGDQVLALQVQPGLGGVVRVVSVDVTPEGLKPRRRLVCVRSCRRNSPTSILWSIRLSRALSARRAMACRSSARYRDGPRCMRPTAMAATASPTACSHASPHDRRQTRRMGRDCRPRSPAAQGLPKQACARACIALRDRH